MIEYDPAVVSYNADGKPYWEVDFLYIEGRDKETDAIMNFYFSNLRRDETVGIHDPQTDSTLNRPYLGGGHIVTLPPIKRSQALTIDQHVIELSLVSADVKNMIYGYNLTRAHFEWHKGQLSSETGKLLALPLCEFYGFLDGIDDKTQAPDDKGKMISTVSISVVPHHAELEYSNQIFRSYEEGKKRDGDEIFLWVDEVGDWMIPWGKSKHKAGDGGHKKDKSKTPESVTNTPKGNTGTTSHS